MNPTDNIWTVKDTFKLPTDHIEFARLVSRCAALFPPPPPALPLTPQPRIFREEVLSDDDTVTRPRSNTGRQTLDVIRKTTHTARAPSAGSPASTPGRRPPLLGQAYNKSNSARGSTGSLNLPSHSQDECGESSDDVIVSPVVSPRRGTGRGASPPGSPMRNRSGSIGSGSSANIIRHANSASLSQLPLSGSASPSPSPSVNSSKPDPTVLWADFLESTHLVANCPIYKPRDALEIIILAALHFYIFCLQSPPPDASSRKEKAKSSGAIKDANEPPKHSTDSTSLEESPFLSKAYRKTLHKNLGAFYPPKQMGSQKLTILEDAIWSVYTEWVAKRATVEEAMTEYTRVFSLWRFSDVKLFFDVKKDVTTLLSLKSFVFALNEDGIAILKKDKDNELVATHLWGTIANWTVSGNVLSLEIFVDDSTVASGVSGTTVSSDSPMGTVSAMNSSTGVLPSMSSTNSAMAKFLMQSSSTTATVTYISPQAETISQIMQFYVDRLVSVVFDRADVLISEPSPRIHLLTAVGPSPDPNALSAHSLAVESLTPALNKLKMERDASHTSSQGASSASDSEPTSESVSLSATAASAPSLKRPSAPGVTVTADTPTRRARSTVEAKNEIASGDESQDGPRRIAKSRRPATPSNASGMRVSPARTSDVDSKESESDRDRVNSESDRERISLHESSDVPATESSDTEQM